MAPILSKVFVTKGKKFLLQFLSQKIKELKPPTALFDDFHN
jgi:hypothetical protein